MTGDQASNPNHIHPRFATFPTLQDTHQASSIFSDFQNLVLPILRQHRKFVGFTSYCLVALVSPEVISPFSAMDEDEQQPRDVPESLEDDTRPEVSPYSGRLHQVSFQDGEPLQVPKSLLLEYPKFYKACTKVRVPDNGPRFPHLPQHVGHVLVHFIFTGRYQCLKPKGMSAVDKRVSEFATALRVCSVAEEYSMPALGMLAKAEVCTLGKDLSLASVIDIIESEQGVSVQNVWVAAYLKLRVKSFCKTMTRTTEQKSLKELEAFPPTTSKLILRSVAELLVSELPSEEEPRQGSSSTAEQSRIGHDKGAATNWAISDHSTLPTTDPEPVHKQPPSDGSFLFPKLDMFTEPYDDCPDPEVRRLDGVVQRGPSYDNPLATKKSKKEKKKERKNKKKMLELAMMEEQREAASDFLVDTESDLSIVPTPTNSSFDWPYTNSFAELRFKDGHSLFIQQNFLQKCPKLAIESDGKRPVKDMSFDAGHVFVHFLVTGDYQCLKPNGKSASDKRDSEFATALRVHSAAQLYSLPQLGGLAEAEMSRLGNQSSLASIKRIIDKECRFTKNTWVTTYFESRVQLFCQQGLTEAGAGLLANGLVTLLPTTSKILLRGVIGFYSRNSLGKEGPCQHGHSRANCSKVSPDEESCQDVEDTKSQIPPASSSAKASMRILSSKWLDFPKTDESLPIHDQSKEDLEKSKRDKLKPAKLAAQEKASWPFTDQSSSDGDGIATPTSTLSEISSFGKYDFDQMAPKDTTDNASDHTSAMTDLCNDSFVMGQGESCPYQFDHCDQYSQCCTCKGCQKKMQDLSDGLVRSGGGSETT
ncbi:hypothetical protein AK830_g932 [Neonectria ditissima]|uniref:BTB domain-containing protein n=1 Tax=Neonectria ditissima TaxID=78410 RepID=A0A0P7BFZ6_9HYPO|nr:hypothetical protein AK830_g932 [Neonectria ditissima]